MRSIVTWNHRQSVYDMLVLLTADEIIPVSRVKTEEVSYIDVRVARGNDTHLPLTLSIFFTIYQYNNTAKIQPLVYDS